MSDLISRKALMQEIGKRRACSHSMTLSDAEFIDLITNAPAIEQSEPEASESHLTKVLKLTALEHAIELSSKHGSGPVDLGCFTVLQDMAEEIRNGNLATPQQPQSVADVLEEAAKICDDNLMSWADNEWNDAVKDCAKRIRALIKRNADGVE